MFKGTGYWLVKSERGGQWTGQLIATKDKGETWTPVGRPIENGDSTYLTVPRFGKDARHIVVAAAGGGTGEQRLGSHVEARNSLPRPGPTDRSVRRHLRLL